jgi:hypothetical protein
MEGVDPAQLLAEAKRSEQRGEAMNDIVLGGLLLAGGIVVTWLTHDAASRGGGTYILAYGPIIGGIIKIVRGLSRLG